MQVILTSYFSKDIGYSQHTRPVRKYANALPCKKDYFDLIKDWYNSVVGLGLNAVVMHNELSDDFVKTYSRANIKFIRYTKQHRPSYLDERFYAYREYLADNPDIEKVLCTDMFDLKFINDPFKLFSDKYRLYVGSEANPGWEWMRNKYKLAGIPPLSEDKILYNAGLVGGYREEMIGLLNEMVSIFVCAPKNTDVDMVAINECLHHKLGHIPVFTGHPLHNVFKSYRHTQDVAIAHK
jgi:hypothetical protein